ncbi:MAG: cyclic nucleotide-binding domain-containing protein, partial [Gammaproteobacteria bacterium]
MHDRLLSLRARGGPLAVLSEQEIADLSTGAEEVRREAGEVLLRAGEQGDEACLVLEGRLAATRTEADGSISVLNEIGPGEFVGEIELVVGGTRMADIRVLEDASLAVLSRTRFEALLQRSPETWERVTRIVEGRLRRMQLSGHLHRLFGPFDPSAGDIPDAMADAIEFLTLPSGEDLFRQGDPADDACIVMSGLLRVAVDREDGSEQVINTVRSGEIVGEMALLSGEPRSATVFAVRDSILARIPRQEFDRLIDIYPGAMKSLTRIIIARLERQSSVAVRRENLHTNIALVAADSSVRLDAVAERLAATMETFGETILLDPDRVDRELNQPGICRVADSASAYPRLAEWLHELTERHRYVLYRADADWSAWTERCVRQADHVVIVADGAADPAPGAVERRLPECWRRGREPQRSLVLLHPTELDRPRGTARWLSARDVDGVYHVRRGNTGDADRLSRILAGRAVGLVLGGGGARGFAHLGVFRALEELGLPVDMIGGASIGAPVAIPTTWGCDAERARELVRSSFSSLLDYTLPVASLLSGRRITRNIYESMASWDIEDLWLPFFCVSTNLTAARTVVHSRGNLAHAVRASVAIPGVLPPVPHEGDLLVDGGVLNNLPIDVMRRVNPTGTVIAIDVAPL